MVFPSGEKVGEVLRRLVSCVNSVCSPAASPVCGETLTEPMLLDRLSALYAIRFPSGAIVKCLGRAAPVLMISTGSPIGNPVSGETLILHKRKFFIPVDA